MFCEMHTGQNVGCQEQNMPSITDMFCEKEENADLKKFRPIRS